ncbi:MAG: NAD+ synthase [Deltaproteobacteria bacterium]|nr:NAD+ synthase [Deltaproteobacteria bacterium]
MKIGLAQINTTIGDFDGNAAKIIQRIEQGGKEGCNLVVFPELALPGYPPADYLARRDSVSRALERLALIARVNHGIGVIIGFIDLVRSGKEAFFCSGAALVTEGHIAAKTYKIPLSSHDGCDEGRLFRPGSGYPAVQFLGKRLVIIMGDDLWNDTTSSPPHSWPKNLGDAVAPQNPNIIINIAGSSFYVGKKSVRREALSAIARKSKAPLIFVNQVGGNDSLLFDGGSMVIDSRGEIRACAQEFEEDFVTFDVETNIGDRHASNDEDEALIYKALCVGTQDYVHKCGFDRVVLGLSGGIDSVVTAGIAVEALGAKKVLGIAMPSPYSSPESLEDARTVAGRLGMEFSVVPISAVLSRFLEELNPLFAGYGEDATEENIQARIRGTILMALANKFNALLLSTGNKSEVAVGYCTLYGDMCGALAVIADIPKTMVYRLARLMNRNREIVPECVFTKAPSAELRPNQTDQDVLPPYEVLDDIIAEYMDRDAAIADIVAKGYDEKVVRDVVRRIHINEYKRRQAAPCLRVTTKRTGSGRRFPLADRSNI